MKGILTVFILLIASFGYSQEVSKPLSADVRCEEKDTIQYQVGLKEHPSIPDAYVLDTTGVVRGRSFRLFMILSDGTKRYLPFQTIIPYPKEQATQSNTPDDEK